MKAESVFAPTPDRRQRYRPSLPQPVEPPLPPTVVGMDKISLSTEGKQRAGEWHEEQARRLVRRPPRITDAEVDVDTALVKVSPPPETIEPITE